jgi:hypothetical protein
MAAAACAGCAPLQDDIDGSLEPLAKAVRESARDGDTFRLSSTTDFRWDRVHFVGPYTTPDEIERELGFEWDDAGESSIRESDFIFLLVFVEAGRVVRAFEHEIGGGHFGCLVPPVVEGGITPPDAVLKVVAAPGGNGGSVDEAFLARPRNEREAKRIEKCLDSYL